MMKLPTRQTNRFVKTSEKNNKNNSVKVNYCENLNFKNNE